MRNVSILVLALVALVATSCRRGEEAPGGAADTGAAQVSPPVTDTVPAAGQDTAGQRPDTAVRDTAR
ncbi:MAG: hypothetical protein KatS3mg081_1495 [Gemmatimonadales bacterium]|nr:MAG: hypothetical protein KatS3mg081_1495 [Gemmatimonadales bacterium]